MEQQSLSVEDNEDGLGRRTEMQDLGIGAKVVIHSHDTKPQYNGARGSVKEYLPDSGLWYVQLEQDGRDVFIQTSNLRVLKQPDVNAAQKSTSKEADEAGRMRQQNRSFTWGGGMAGAEGDHLRTRDLFSSLRMPFLIRDFQYHALLAERSRLCGQHSCHCKISFDAWSICLDQSG